jgi:hydroxymethylglutaryl-CoA lyase
MSGRYPEIVYTEEGMREGMQIEHANIPIDAKVALLDALSETGLKRSVVGSFVRLQDTPQMARIDALMQKFHPKEGVTYTALALNEQGVERAKKYSPPLTIERSRCPTLRVHMCDVFARRNTNRTQMQEMAVWPQFIAKAKEHGAIEAGISTNASFGSNFLGDFPVDAVYAGGIYPWKEPITSPYRERVEQGLPPFEVEGDWPWNEPFFPKPSTITNQDGQ